MKKALSLLFIALLAASAWYFTRTDPAANPVLAGDNPSVNVMPFSSLSDVDELPEGWSHRKFWLIPAMELSLVDHEGKRSVKCVTNGGGSILGRSTSISLKDFPIMKWDWFIETPISSDVDESTEEGDDHPARLFIQFRDQDGENHPLEVIWSNRKYVPGDYKYIGDFPHYVANGLDVNIGEWHHQEIDLMAIYQTTTQRKDSPTVTSVAIFCDSDNTGGESAAYFSDVYMEAR